MTDAGSELITTFTYDELTSGAIDANGHKRETETDGRGRTLAVMEYTGNSTYSLYATTAYEYDALDSLTKVIDELGKETEMAYDMLGRKTQMADPDMGAWTYAYDAAVNLVEQTDARGVETTLAYDGLNRLLGKSFAGGSPAVTDGDVTYTYDAYPSGSPCAQAAATAKGQLTKMDDDPGAEHSCFDIRGRHEDWSCWSSRGDDVSATADPPGSAG